MKRSRFIRSEVGLTLVEIMIVLVILAIVMAFLGRKLIGAGDKAKANITNLQMKELQNDIEQFRLAYNSLPDSLQDLAHCTQKTGQGCVPITKEDSLKDAWGNPFSYAIQDNGRRYQIKSLGADGRDGGEEINYDISVTGP